MCFKQIKCTMYTQKRFALLGVVLKCWIVLNRRTVSEEFVLKILTHPRLRGRGIAFIEKHAECDRADEETSADGLNVYWWKCAHTSPSRSSPARPPVTLHSQRPKNGLQLNKAHSTSNHELHRCQKCECGKPRAMKTSGRRTAFNAYLMFIF